VFAPHHYLTQSLSNGCRAWLGVLDGDPVVFTSAMTLPSPSLKGAWREHRTVVLPDYQGLGIGLRMSEWLGELFIRQGGRFYSRTAHPRIGEAREVSPLWRATGKNLRMRKAEWSGAAGHDTTRLAYSHEYVGVALSS
jgi:GNAT superfamily N-acetyltransferase